VRPDRDYQRARVYAWEDRVVAPRDRSTLPYPAAQGMVSAIWADIGLRFPPTVAMLPGQARRLQADASRLLVRLPQTMPSWLLLHEMAHALSSTHEGASDGHGPTFMGLYIELLERYMRWSGTELVISAVAGGIDVDRDARPLFLDRS
jgi:hypothetical protein